MANTSNPEQELHSLCQENEDNKQTTIFPRPVAPTVAQVAFMSFDLDALG